MKISPEETNNPAGNSDKSLNELASRVSSSEISRPKRSSNTLLESSSTHEVELPSGRIIETHAEVVPELTSTLERMLNLLDETSTSLAEREEMFRALAETIPSPIYVLHNLKVLYANPAAVRFGGVASKDDLVQKNLAELIHPDDIKLATDLLARKNSGEDVSGSYLFRILNANGRYILHSARLQNAMYRGLKVGITVTTDLSKQQSLKKELQREKSFMREVLDALSVPTVLTDIRGNITEFNNSAEVLLGKSASSVRGQNSSMVLQLVNFTDQTPISDPVLQALQEQKIIEHQKNVFLQVQNGDNQYIEVKVKATPLYSRNKILRGASLELQEYKAVVAENERLTYQATHDSLTNLINRREFENRLRNALEEMKHTTVQHTLCYIDLNNFKPVNDTAGHQAGDEILKQVAKKLKEVVRETDSVGRIGGDEFGILLHGCPLDKAKDIAQQLCESLASSRFTYDEHSFAIGAAVGMVVLNKHDNAISDVLNAADTACYIAKKSGGSRFHVFDRNDNYIKRDQGSSIWRRRILDALTYNGFEVFVQKVHAVNEISGITPLITTNPTFETSLQRPSYEVSVRMIDNFGTMYRPELFLPAARSHDLLSSIDRIVVQNTFDAMAQGWINVGKDECVSINLSAETFSDEEFLSSVVDALDQYKIDSKNLCFEVPESDVIANLDSAKRFIKVLNDLGCQFAIDDFGRELQSFSYLRELNINYIKLDGFYIRTIEEDEVNRAMVAAMIKLAHSLGMRVIAEQVESQGVLNVLAELGADFAQGEAVSPVLHLHDALSI